MVISLYLSKSNSFIWSESSFVLKFYLGMYNLICWDLWKEKKTAKVKQFSGTADKKRNPRMPEKQIYWNQEDNPSSLKQYPSNGNEVFLLGC